MIVHACRWRMDPRRTTRRRLSPTCLSLLLTLLAALPAVAERPLHERIDELVESTHVAPAAPLVGDAEFLRRVSLDLTGRIPTAAEAREFLADASPDKRVRLIDQLLASPQYVRHMATALDVMLMERRRDQKIKADEWHQYLYDSVQQNKPFDQLAREILAADGADVSPRPAVKFYLDREGELNALTRDVGRIFFGRDLQCAQCHDHPLIQDYYQADYYGIFSFLSRSFVFTGKDKKEYFAEKAVGEEVNFKSVFTGEEGTAGPQLPGGKVLDEPMFAEGDEYQVKPEKNVRPVPKYSRRQRLAEEATSGRNRAFNRNIANRLWAHMLGRGLVDPVDLHHGDNPASNPALLDLLTEEIVACDFDMRAFLRELALTRTYQRSVQLPAELAQHAPSSERLSELEQQHKRRVAALEQASQSVLASGEQADQAEKAAQALRQQLAEADKQRDAAREAANQSAQQRDRAEQALAARQEALAAVECAALAARDAVAQLPDEITLVEAAGKFQERSRQLAEEIPPLEKQAASLAAEAEKARAQLTAADQTSQKLAGQLAAADKKLAESQQAVSDSRAARDEAARLAGRAERLLAAGQQLFEYRQARDAAERAQQQVVQLEAALRQRRSQSEQLAAVLPESRAAATDAQASFDAAELAYQETEKAADERQQKLTVFTSAAETAEAARAVLAEGDALIDVAEQLKTRQQQLADELAAARQAAAARRAERDQAAKKRTDAAQKVAQTETMLQEARSSVSDLEAKLAPAVEQRDASEAALAELERNLVQDWTRTGALAALKPLTPEQLAWSIMQCTGVVEQQHAAAASQLAKQQKEKKDAAQPTAADTARQLEQIVYDKLKGNVGTYVQLFGAGAGQPQHEFFATVDQALYFANGGQLNSWLAPSGNNLTSRLLKIEDPAQLADELYLSVLTRRPTDQEVADAAQFLADHEDRRAAVQELAWALVTSVEFRFNH